MFKETRTRPGQAGKSRESLAARFRRLVARGKQERIVAVVGDAAGNVYVDGTSSGTTGALIHISNPNGEYLGKAWNNAVHPVYGLFVTVGHDERHPGMWTVLGTHDTDSGNYVTPAYKGNDGERKIIPNVAPHKLCQYGHIDVEFTEDELLEDGFTLVWDAAKQLWVPGDIASSVNYPYHATMWHDESRDYAGGLPTDDKDGIVPSDADMTSGSYYGVLSEGWHPSNAYFEQYFGLAAGTYTFGVMGIILNASCDINWTVDGSTILSGQDWYTGENGSPDQRYTTGVSIATSSMNHVLRGTLSDTHTVAPRLVKYFFERTGD